MQMEDTKEAILTALDRCDSCGSQAYFMVIFERGDLVFCRHHFMENEVALRVHSYHIIDQSDMLKELA
jgi:hypothetical protein